MASSSAASLERSQGSVPQPLDSLIPHLLASKRSLASISHIYRANSIVTSARSILERSVATSARTLFLRRALSSQLHVLRAIQYELEGVVTTSQDEFAGALQELDAAEARLSKTLDALGKTTVAHGPQSHEHEHQTLLDFADLRGIEEVKQSLRTSIDDFNASSTEVEESHRALDDLLKAAHDALREQDFKSSISSQKTLPQSQVRQVPTLLRTLESNATEAATHLESLVRHYDLCVTAVKHTEGGLTALTSANFNPAESLNLPSGVDVDTHDAQQPLEQFSDEARQEMISVVGKDALEVDSVVAEIADLLNDMESGLEKLVAFHGQIDADYARITHAHALLDDINRKLPDFIAESRAFSDKWQQSREAIQGGMLDLADLRDFYIGFLTAYDGLRVEMKRRKAVRSAMEKVVKDADSRLQKLYDEDSLEREKFNLDQGQFLPSNIWPGIGEKPDLWHWERIDGATQRAREEEEEKDAREQQAQQAEVSLHEENHQE